MAVLLCHIATSEKILECIQYEYLKTNLRILQLPRHLALDWQAPSGSDQHVYLLSLCGVGRDFPTLSCPPGSRELPEVNCTLSSYRCLLCFLFHLSLSRSLFFTGSINTYLFRRSSSLSLFKLVLVLSLNQNCSRQFLGLCELLVGR